MTARPQPYRLPKLRRLQAGVEAPRVVDLFSGCGGMSLGFHAAGCEIVAGIEKEEIRARTHARNFHRHLGQTLEVEHAKPHDAAAPPLQTLQKFTGKLVTDVDILIGGPPCQAYARVGRAKLREIAQHPEAWLHDDRGQLYAAYMEWVRTLAPTIVVMENVPDILRYGNENIAEVIAENLDALGYVARYTLLNAAAYGVPQTRERWFLIAVRKEVGIIPTFPLAPHAVDLPVGYRGTRAEALRWDVDRPAHAVPIPERLVNAAAAVTAEQALGDLPMIPDEVKLMGKGRRDLTAALAYRARAQNAYQTRMRSWGLFRTKGEVTAHVIRSLPRDYETFRRMKEGDDYPKAFAIAQLIFEEAVEKSARSGHPVAPGSEAWNDLRASIVPPYDDSKFPEQVGEAPTGLPLPHVDGPPVPRLLLAHPLRQRTGAHDLRSRGGEAPVVPRCLPVRRRYERRVRADRERRPSPTRERHRDARARPGKERPRGRGGADEHRMSAGHLIVKRLRQSELGFFEACRRAGRETAKQRALNMDTDVLRAVFGPLEDVGVQVRTRWHDGQRMVDDLRPLKLQKKNWRLGGTMVPGQRFGSAKPDDIVLLDVRREADHPHPWLVTWDIVSQNDRETWSLFEMARRQLREESAVLVTPPIRETILGVATRRLAAFGAMGHFDTAGLPDEAWDLTVRWLARMPVDRLMQLDASEEADMDAVLLEVGGQRSDLSASELAESLLRRFGDELLADPRRRALLADEVRVPHRWERGSVAARLFVEDLGLHTALAGVPVERPPDIEDVDAWPPLAPLHAYQEELAAQIRDVLAAGTWEKKRAILWLPTGTGKTRVTVETLLVHTLLQPPRNCLLWIADRDELCEQAVETFRHVWMVRGRDSATCRSRTVPALRIVRMWGGREWREPGEAPTVVVASVQSLSRRLATEAFQEELALFGDRCAAVVFDEAHHVVAPSYARVLEALGFSRSTNYLGRNRTTAPPLLGLTATPARQTGDETARLAARFGGRLLEPGPEWRSLSRFQADGYLSRLRIEVVRTGYALALTESEQGQLQTFGSLPDSALRRAGEDATRTARIVADLEQRLASLLSVLVFACSVAHARTIAEVLVRRGVSAAALDGTAPRHHRWRTIERFRAGELRVLVNCDLLATGFDAPNVDGVAIARPVESSVLFAQIVGRGLRGPLNGGTETCTLIDYEDALVGHGDLERLRASFRQAFRVETGLE
jgi:DNA (cytosine-5)-methyltransferase 1